MLFDLRSRRRRRVVKIVYVFLALLIGGRPGRLRRRHGRQLRRTLQRGERGGGTGTGAVAIDETALAEGGEAGQGRTRAAPRHGPRRRAPPTRSSQTARHYVDDQGYTKAGFRAARASSRRPGITTSPLPAEARHARSPPRSRAPSGRPPGIAEYAIAESAQELVAESDPSTTREYETLASTPITPRAEPRRPRRSTGPRARAEVRRQPDPDQAQGKRQPTARQAQRVRPVPAADRR